MPNTDPPSSTGTPQRGRFAPSPTGALHLGSAMAALGSWLFARHAGGEWWLRIEDLDPPREVAGAAAGQRRMLTAMGLVPDGRVVAQSTRGALYARALEQLLDDGRAFRCHCSRAGLAAVGGVHRECSPGVRRRDPAVRLRVEDGLAVTFSDMVLGTVSQDVAGQVGDFVLRRADGLWAYQLAVVVDDAAQRITEVVRGADLLGSTPRQILLQRALGLTTPRHAHLPVVVDAGGDKLSKSLRSLPVDPTAPLPVLAAAWRLLGQDHAAIAGARDVGTLLSAAQRAFAPRSVPGTPQRATPFAALHNGDPATAE